MRSRARSGVASTSPPAPISLMVSATATAGIAAPVRPAAAIAREITADVTKGRAASWISTISGLALASASSPACTEAWRVAPPLVGGAWRSELTASLKTVMSSGFTTGCTVAISGCRQKASMARRITVLPPTLRYCLGPPEPARSPRPAATRMAAVRSGLGMRLQGLSGRIGIDGGAPRRGLKPHSPYHAHRQKQSNSR